MQDKNQMYRDEEIAAMERKNNQLKNSILGRGGGIQS